MHPDREDRSIERLAQRNPIPLSTVENSVRTPEAQELLRRILSDSTTTGITSPKTRITRRRVLAAAAIVATGAMALQLIDFPGGHHGIAYAATPAPLQFDPTGMPNARAVLTQLAEKAAVAAPAPGRGTYDYVLLQGWYVNSAVTRKGATSTIEPTLTETWTSRDGSGRSVKVAGEVEVRRVGGRNEVRIAKDGTRDTDTLTFGKDGAQRIPLVDLSRFSRDPKALSQELLVNSGTLTYSKAENNPDWFQRITNIRELYRRQVIPPDLQAALLRVLSETPGLVTLGRGRDRVGRRVVAVGFQSTAHGRPAAFNFLFDPYTGALVGYEEIITTLLINPATGRDYLNIKIPAVVNYEAHLAAGRTNATNARP
jgi:hypothetical protein